MEIAKMKILNQFYHAKCYRKRERQSDICRVAFVGRPAVEEILDMLLKFDFVKRLHPAATRNVMLYA